MKELLAILLLCCAILNSSLGQSSLEVIQSNVRFVNPLIGTAASTTRSALAHGQGSENSAQVIPEVTAPFGMTNWTPQTRHVETKCVAPYDYNDTLISGFRGTHWLSGSCTQDYGSFSLMPISGTLRCLPEVRGSHYSRKNGVSSPFYYRVALEDNGIECELTATTRCGYCRFTYSRSDTGFIVFEPNSDYGEGFVRINPQRNEITVFNPVHRIYQAWGEPAGFRGYFVAQFSQPFESYGTYEGPAIRHGRTEIAGKKKIGGFVRFLLRKNRTIVVRIGTSFTSIEQARKNLAMETDGLGFDGARKQLQATWNKTLSKVSVTGGSEDAKVQFYTALYHSFLLPRVFSDCDGSYPSFAGGDSICHVKRGNYYCDFSLWDTYRALHPLFNLVIPEVNSDMVKSLLLKARQGGWLPIFPCWNSYTSAMIGDHAIAVIADAVVKGVVRLSDRDYEYLKKNATQLPADRAEYLNGKGVRALDSYMRYGYVPLDDSVKESFHKGEQVSRTLEYAYDDFALSQIAGAMGKKNDQQYFTERSKNYRNVYDASVKCVNGRFADGRFTSDFNKSRRMPYITEGTPWQYTWYVPHDVAGMIKMMGGPREFNDSLDAFFANGQYWHGNEPDQQVPFLYNYSGAPWKTQKIVGRILQDEYSNTPGGLSGNDDSGQMSAWYVFAAMGLYPVCPSKDEYTLTSPSFEKIVLHLAGGKRLVIKADGASAGKRFIASIDFNGKPIENFVVRHSELMKGGTLMFRMQEGLTPFVPLPLEGGG
jgi:predicted alpha-1,2-mannosidase